MLNKKSEFTILCYCYQMDKLAIDKFIGTVFSKKLVKFSQLLSLRFLSKNFKKSIDDQCLYYYIDTIRKIGSVLFYNTKIYDQFYYKRLIISNGLKESLTKYKAQRIPKIEVQSYEDECIYSPGYQDMPNEYYILLDFYNKYPSVRLKLLPVALLVDLAEWQYEFLCNKISLFKTDADVDNIIFVTPICYVKHFRKSSQDDQFISVFCYTNTVSLNLSAIFGDKKFFSFEITPKDMEDNTTIFKIMDDEAKKYTQKIKEQGSLKYIPANIASNSKRFGDAFMEFYKKQNFNI